MVEVCIPAALGEMICAVHSPQYSVLGSVLKQAQLELCFPG